MTIGINYKSAPITIREQVVFDLPKVRNILADLLLTNACKEVALVSTCNRTELYCKTNMPRNIIKSLQKLDLININALKSYSYVFYNRQAVAHLYRVAAGLDSMVLGETEILGQLKSAYHIAKQIGGIGKYLNKLFESAFSVGKFIRSQTKVGADPISIAYIAVRLAKTIFADLSLKKVLVVGAGSTAELIVKHLLASGVKNFLLANRTRHKSVKLYEKVLAEADCQCEILDLQELPDKIYLADIILSSTASPLPIIGKGMIERAINLRKNQAMFIIDIAVPRDVEVEVNKIADVYLYCIDDLKSIASKNRQSRQEAALDAESIVESQVSNFSDWIDTNTSTQVIVDFRNSFTQIRDELLHKALYQMQQGRDPKQVLSSMASGLTNKLLHMPTMNIKQAALNKDVAYLNVVKSLFNLL